MALTITCLLLSLVNAALVAYADSGREVYDPVSAAMQSFPDVVGDHWAAPFIMRLVNENAINGYPDGSFGPTRSITRAEFVKITVNSLLEVPPSPLPGQHWAVNIIEIAQDNNLLEAGEFAPDTWDQPINRQEMAKIMARASQYIRKEALDTNTESYSSKIVDFNTISDGYKPYIAQAYAKGLVTGYTDGSFGGERPATRAEASAMLVRLLDPAYRLCEITFDPAVDVAADGRMKLAKAEQYLMKNLHSLKFYTENGKFYFEGYVAEVPPDFDNWIAISFQFKQGSGLPVADYDTIPSILFHEDVVILPRVGPFKEEVAGISGPEIIDNIMVTMAIEAPNHTNTTYNQKSYEVLWLFYSNNDNRIACIDKIGIEEQINKFYDLSQIFQW